MSKLGTLFLEGQSWISNQDASSLYGIVHEMYMILDPTRDRKTGSIKLIVDRLLAWAKQYNRQSLSLFYVLYGDTIRGYEADHSRRGPISEAYQR